MLKSKKPKVDHSLVWRVHTPNLLSEILGNNETQMLKRPVQMLANLLDNVAIRASQLNDPILNALMCQLAMYEISDPYSENYNSERVLKIITKGVKQMGKLNEAEKKTR